MTAVTPSVLRRSMRCSGAAVVCVGLSSLLVAAQKTDDKKAPRLSLKAQPLISMSPSRVVLTAELTGGPNDYQDFYCPTIAWEWGDGTESSSTADCEPYEPGKSEIKRRYTVQHQFRAGDYRIWFRLKRHDNILASANATIEVRPGGRDDFRN